MTIHIIIAAGKKNNRKLENSVTVSVSGHYELLSVDGEHLDYSIKKLKT